MKFYLVLEKRPGDFMPININILLNNEKPKDYANLQNIDDFTRMYTYDELKNLIEKNNIVTPDYLEGKLWVINDNKYRFEVLTKDINMSLDTFLASNINDKLVMNKFVNIYLKYNKDNIDIIKESVKNKRIDIILQTLFSLPYEIIRRIYFYLYNNVN